MLRFGWEGFGRLGRVVRIEFWGFREYAGVWSGEWEGVKEGRCF